MNGTGTMGKVVDAEPFSLSGGTAAPKIAVQRKVTQ